MRARLTLLVLILSGGLLSAQATTPVTFSWDLDPTHVGATFDVEVDGTVQPCGSVTTTASDRRCTATAVPYGAHSFRLRGTLSGTTGPWSPAVTGTIAGPGPFTIRTHQEAPRPPMAVAFDAKMTGGNGTAGASQQTTNATSISSTGMTIGSGTLLVGVLVFGSDTKQAPTGIAMTWNGVSMTAGPTITSVSGGSQAAVAMFYLVNPATGNKTLAASWTHANDAYLSCVSFSGTDTSVGVQTADNTTASQTTSISVPTDSAGATVAVFAVNGAAPTVNQTQIFSQAPNDPGGAASYALGGSGTNSHTFTGAGGTRQALAGLHVIAATGAAFLARPTPLIAQAVKRASYF